MNNKKEFFYKDSPEDPSSGMYSPSQSFNKIGLMEAMHGDIILRGREGGRDHLIVLEKAVEKYYDSVRAVLNYCKHGVRGWDTLKDITDDLKARIFEAIAQRRKLGRPIAAIVLKFEQVEK